MSEEKTANSEELKADEKSGLVAKLSAGGWGLFGIWIGIVMLAKIGAGIGLLGVGIITLGMQVVRKCFSLSLEGFWLVVGVLSIVAGSEYPAPNRGAYRRCPQRKVHAITAHQIFLPWLQMPLV